MPHRERTAHAVLAHGQTVPYAVAGAGPPVVLVHGLGGSARIWKSTATALATRYCVYRLDLPGFGSLRGHDRLALAEAADWLRRVLEAIDLPATYLVGHSMGAYICLRLAAAAPEAVRRLALVAPSGVPTGWSLLGHAIRFLCPAPYTPPSAAPALLWDLLRAHPLAMWRAARALVAEDARASCRLIAMPTLLLWGSADPLGTARVRQVWCEALPQAQVVVLPRAGHAPMVDQPALFATALCRFLADEAVG